MHAIEICVDDVILTRNEDSSKNAMALIEAQCEAALLRNPNRPFGAAIARALNCPNDCSGHGKCVEFYGCECDQHFQGHDCSLSKDTSMIIEQKHQLCDVKFEVCLQISVKGVNFEPEGTCNGIPYAFVDSQQIICSLDSSLAIEPIQEINLVIKTSSGQEDALNLVVYDSTCDNCQLAYGDVRCQPQEKVCRLSNQCFEHGVIHPHDKCLRCNEGDWLAKSDESVSLATSELNKKFKVINGQVFEYSLPRIDNNTDYKLISGPYGAILMDNGTLSWRAMSNLIADSWTELFIIKAKGSCNENTLVEINVHVVSCDCLNDAKCVLAHDIPKCLCKPGYRGDRCEVMEDPCMVPRCNFGQCVPIDGIQFQCLCDPGYTGSLCSQPLHCNCAPGVDCLDHDKCGPCPPGFTGDGFQCAKIRPCDTQPCFEGVECFAIGDDDFVCGACPPTLTGNGKQCYESSNDFLTHLCDHDDTNPCFAKELCQVNELGVYCRSCPKGFKGDGITCHPVDSSMDPCSESRTNPCYPGSKCQVVNGIVTCGPCPANMTGDGKLCYAKQPSVLATCDPNPCYPGVQCETQNGEPVCGACPSGLAGDGLQCSEIKDHCAREPCFPGAACYNYHDRFECGACPEGFSGNGQSCTPVLDPCDPNPCHEGVSCVTVWKGRQTMFECGFCPDGMVGDGFNCTWTDPCHSNPCRPGSFCQSQVSTFKCLPCAQEKCSQSFIVPCPDVNHCFPGVECIMTNNSLQVPYITCGECPDGFAGDGIQCRPLCNNCNSSLEICVGPNICQSKDQQEFVNQRRYDHLFFFFTREVQAPMQKWRPVLERGYMPVRQRIHRHRLHGHALQRWQDDFQEEKLHGKALRQRWHMQRCQRQMYLPSRIQREALPKTASHGAT